MIHSMEEINKDLNLEKLKKMIPNLEHGFGFSLDIIKNDYTHKDNEGFLWPEDHYYLAITTKFPCNIYDQNRYREYFSLKTKETLGSLEKIHNPVYFGFEKSFDSVHKKVKNLYELAKRNELAILIKDYNNMKKYDFYNQERDFDFLDNHNVDCGYYPIENIKMENDAILYKEFPDLPKFSDLIGGKIINSGIASDSPYSGYFMMDVEKASVTKRYIFSGDEYGLCDIIHCFNI